MSRIGYSPAGGSGGGGDGDATEAKQDATIALLTAIYADLENLVVYPPATYNLTPFNGEELTVSTSITLLAPANEDRGLLMITNLGPTIIRVGSTDLTSNTGAARLDVGDVLILEAPSIPTGAIYGIVESGANAQVLVAENNIGDAGFGGGGFGQ